MEIPEQAKHFFRDHDHEAFKKIEWDVEDWKIWYECLGFAIWRIMRRKRGKPPEEIDFQI